MKRFTRYLHESFYVNADVFMKAKHTNFMKRQNPSKVSTVFDRLEQDKNNRAQTQMRMEDAREPKSNRSSTNLSRLGTRSFTKGSRPPSTKREANPK